MHLFTYGTLMDPEIMRKVSGGTFASFQTALCNYQRYTVRDQPYPGMIAKKGGRVEGVVYLDLSPAALERLDLFEGEMYSRETVVVNRGDDGCALEVFAYVVKPKYAHLLTTDAWDFQQFLERGKRLFADEYRGFDDLGEC